MSAKVLLMVNDQLFAQQLRAGLGAEGFRIDVSRYNDAAQTVIVENPPDLIVLDCLPSVFSGLELCRRIRRNPATRHTAIIMLATQGGEGDIVRGFAAGADHYVVKPCSVAELVARARAILGRTSPARIADVIMVADIQLDREQRRVIRDGGTVELGAKEFRLLEFLMENPERVLTRSQILDGVWGHDADVNERTVDVHIGRLRKALDRRGGCWSGRSSRLIRTVRSVGYALDGRLSHCETNRREASDGAPAGGMAALA